MVERKSYFIGRSNGWTRPWNSTHQGQHGEGQEGIKTIPLGKPETDFLLPDEQETLQKEQGGSSTDSKKKVSFTPTPKPSTSKPLRIVGKTAPKPHNQDLRKICSWKI